MANTNPRWAFFSYAHNLGDFTRAIETAKGLKNKVLKLSSLITVDTTWI